MRIDEARADYTLQICLHLLMSELFYDSISDGDVTLLSLKIVPIDYCALQEKLTPFRHSPAFGPAIYLASRQPDYEGAKIRRPSQQRNRSEDESL